MSIHEIDVLEVQEPVKKVGIPDRNKTNMIICKNCGTIYEGFDNNAVCPLCHISNNQIDMTYTKFKVS